MSFQQQEAVVKKPLAFAKGLFYVINDRCLYEANHSKGRKKAKENRANADIKSIVIVLSD
ncbi:hypothetical protein ABHF33_16575 [Chitinibacter sp. FCG-7]|uniref:Uncharacterized protein n=1 Tax=Chitinibacter mangrovi TaxID=3153927 RepID=A0AAU7FAL2_9NEIS